MIHLPAFKRFATEKFVADVWEVCEAHECSVTGGCRTEARNALPRIGGHPQSRHLFKYGWGLACDVVADDPRDVSSARRELERRGYSTYVGESYAPGQFHVQAFHKGQPLPTDGGTET